MGSDLKFYCTACMNKGILNGLPHFRALIEHYEEAHPGQLKRYEIKNKGLKQTALLEAPSAVDACQSLGWPMNKCKIKEIDRSEQKPTKTRDNPR